MSRTTPKLPVASAGAKQKLSIFDADWSRIEKAYGNKLLPEVRKSIHQATQDFVDWEVFERAAEPRSNARNRLALVRKAANEFQQQLLGRALNSDSHIYANHLIKKHFHDTYLPKGDYFQQIHSILGSFIFACDKGLAEIEGSKSSGFYEGDRWGLWVCQLTVIARTNDLKWRIRKDFDKQKSVASSPFVVMVNRLQECLPRECRRHEHSFEGLGQAILRARRERRGKKGATTPRQDLMVMPADEELFAAAISDAPAQPKTGLKSTPKRSE